MISFLPNNNIRGLSTLCFILLVILTSCQEQSSGLPEGEWVDLSYSFDSTTIFWPTAAPFQLDTLFVGISEQGFFYSAFTFTTPEHGGTHLDAPFHFAEGKKTVNELGIDDLSGAAVIVDISEKALQNPDYLLSVNDLMDWEKEYGALSDGIILFIRTGYGQYWPDREKYLGTSKMGSAALPEMHFPGIGPEAAQWLVNNRNIKAIGIDTPSIDYGQSQDFKSHQILYQENIPGFENLANLDKLPITGFWVMALPMKIAGGSGGPLRVVALIPSKY